MENTGRIQATLKPAARRILFGDASDNQSSLEEIAQIARVDQAHLLMLMECGIVDRVRVARLLSAINRLSAVKFAPLWQKAASRGLYLLYEDFLIEAEGAAVGGILQTARSRNDLSATVFKLRLRAPYLRLVEECLRLQAILLQRAKRNAAVVMPLYTHGQAAVPATFGYYLAGIAKALSRDLDGIFAATQDLGSCPLGAGAVAGTSFPINTLRTAQLLGFDAGPLNSLDAVASRDLVLRLLSATSIYCITLSRLATDFLQWTTAEFDFLHLPDELVGSSSAMPQKRNPFLLEHIQGRAASLVGAFVHSATSMHAAPFTNSIAVGTEAVKPIWQALRNATEIVILMRLMISGVRPNPETMLRRADTGFTTATEFANRLVVKSDLDFRSAHQFIGRAVRESLEDRSLGFVEAVANSITRRGLNVPVHDINAMSVAQSLESGGGPGASSFSRSMDYLQRLRSIQYQRKDAQKRQWRAAEIMLEEEIHRVLIQTSGNNSSE